MFLTSALSRITIRNQILLYSYLMLMHMYRIKTPYVVDTAENGKVGVEKFKSGDYNLLLMNMDMPVTDGYQATKKIRKWEAKGKKESIQIIALTAHTLNELRQKSIDA